jgi:hypothetical protein
MSFFTDLQARVDALGVLLGCEVEPARLPVAVAGLGDEDVLELLSVSAELARAVESVTIAASGVIASRSARERGHSGLAQTRGHRSPVGLVQDLTGASRADAARRVRIGEGLARTLDDPAPGGGEGVPQVAFPGLWADGDAPGSGEAGGAGTGGGAGGSSSAPDGGDGGADGVDGAGLAGAGADGSSPGASESGKLLRPLLRPWHAPLDDALLAGALNAAQHQAITRGLGEPPVPAGDEAPGTAGSTSMVGDTKDTSDDGNEVVDAATVAALREAEAAHTREAWALAAEQLLGEAGERTVEDLARTARLMRDRLDPEGAQRRFDERYRARAFRMWTDADGVYRASVSFDDETAVWVRTIIDTALRPRRGGPRFVDCAEKERADMLRADERSNDQLAYDLVMDVLRAGALADANTVFGTRQAGVRVIITSGDLDAARHGGAGVGATEDSPQALPAWLVDQRTCEAGIRPITLDGEGNPLFLGRDERLFTTTQRIALASRDGGCRWTGCDQPASYCEAHHIDPWHTGGRTDIDRGILLCRFHHMNLHHGRWRITRDGAGDFRLHPPPGRGDPVALRPRLAVRYAWGDHAPPPKRFIPAA